MRAENNGSGISRRKCNENGGTIGKNERKATKSFHSFSEKLVMTHYQLTSRSSFRALQEEFIQKFSSLSTMSSSRTIIIKRGRQSV